MYTPIILVRPLQSTSIVYFTSEALLLVDITISTYVSNRLSIEILKLLSTAATWGRFFQVQSHRFFYIAWPYAINKQGYFFASD